MPDEPRFARRRFFSHGLRELLKPLSRAVEPLQHALKQFEDVLDDPRCREEPPNNARSIRGNACTCLRFGCDRRARCFRT